MLSTILLTLNNVRCIPRLIYSKMHPNASIVNVCYDKVDECILHVLPGPGNQYRLVINNPNEIDIDGFKVFLSTEEEPVDVTKNNIHILQEDLSFKVPLSLFGSYLYPVDQLNVLDMCKTKHVYESNFLLCFFRELQYSCKIESKVSLQAMGFDVNNLTKHNIDHVVTLAFIYAEFLGNLGQYIAYNNIPKGVSPSVNYIVTMNVSNHAFRHKKWGWMNNVLFKQAVQHDWDIKKVINVLPDIYLAGIAAMVDTAGVKQTIIGTHQHCEHLSKQLSVYDPSEYRLGFIDNFGNFLDKEEAIRLDETSSRPILRYLINDYYTKTD